MSDPISPVSPPRSSREETPKDSPVPLDIEAAQQMLRDLVNDAILKEEKIRENASLSNDTPHTRAFIADSQHRTGLLRSLASSLSGIADMKRGVKDRRHDLRLDRIEQRHRAGFSMMRDDEVWLLAELRAARLASDSGTERTP